MLNSTAISALFFLFLAIGTWHITGRYTELGGFVPQVTAVALGFFSLVQLVVAVVQKKEERPFAGIDPKRLLSMAAGIVAYLVLLIYVGFLLSSLLFLTFFFWFLSLGQEERPNMPKLVLLAAGISLGFYLLFNKVFYVPLPWGVFGG